MNIETSHQPVTEYPLNWRSLTANEALAAVRERHLWSHRLHLLAALVYVGSIGCATAPASIMFVVLGLISLARFYQTWRTYRQLFQDLVGWLMVAWGAWHALSLFWSPDVTQGLDELAAFRIVATPFLLWPVMEHVTCLIGAFVAGVAAQNLVQLGQALHVSWLYRPEDGVRLRGFLHPVSTGTLCAIAMCWHLSAILAKGGWTRRLSVLGFGAAGLGLIATGSRGPWIAAAIALPLAWIGMMLRRPALRRPALVFLAVCIVGAAASWPIVNDIVGVRFNRTLNDLKKVEGGEFKTDIGYRLISWEAAWEMFAQSPWRGAGAGGYRSATATTEHAALLAHANHAHSSYMQILATTGAVGGLIALAMILAALHRTWRDRPDHPFAHGTFFAMMAWLIAAAFDASHLSGLMFGMWGLMVVVTRPQRPPPLHAATLLGWQSAKEEHTSILSTGQSVHAHG